MKRKPVIGVMGGHAVSPNTEAIAESLGKAIAGEGWILLNGGRNEGVMRASAKGAHEAGGFVIGIHPGETGNGDVAEHLDIAVFTGIGFARNHINILTSDVVVALPGSYGTMNEITFAKTHGKPVILYGFQDDHWFGDGVCRVDNEGECMREVRRILAEADD